MNDKQLFSDNYLSFQPPPCAKQIQQGEQQTYFSYTTVPLSTGFSPTTSFMDIYNISPQNANRNHQMNCTSHNAYQDQIDLLSWEHKVLPDMEKTIKIPDKIDMIEITSKDLSPASYCSNIDLLVTDCYKTPNKDVSYYNNQWYYNQNNYNQKNFEYSSCAQEKSVNYCNNQKNQDVDSLIKSCTFTSNVPFSETDTIYKNPINKMSVNDVSHDYNIYNYYDKFQETQPLVQNDYFSSTTIPFEPIINPIDQQTEGSNDESDIIVEESDEEITDYSEDPDKRVYTETNKCLICNVMYTPLGRQFYFLTSENPLSMSSQRPVFNKIVEIVGTISTAKNYLCSECLGLINTIDHLQLKLENFNAELISKFEKTCKENNIECTKTTSCNMRIKKRFVNKFTRYKCKICKKVLCLKKYCYYHIKKHKNPGYLCEICGKVYPKKHNFLLHVKQHSKKSSTKIDSYKCSNCVKTFRTKSNLKEHKNYCLGTLPFKCKNQHCDKKFASATKLKNHVKLKHDKKFIAICSICNIGFIKVSDYKSHMITHSTEKKYSCTKCDKSYKTLSNLNFHMKMHNGKLPFICHICDKGFMRKEYLEAHINNHNGVKNYNCTSCDKKFVSQKNLDSHLKYHEGTVKKNTCNVCGKTMTTGFEEHLRIHNNLREFECDQCDKKFNTRGTLSKHVKKKHTNTCNAESSIT